MIRRLVRGAALGVALGLGGAAAAQAQAPEAALGDLLGAFQARYGFPGATAAIALPTGEIVTAATGLADVEAGTPMRPDTRMLAASIGKTFVAATVLSAVAEGRIAEADLLADHLGDRPWFDRLPNAGGITVGQLLRHAAGLPDHVHMDSFAAEMSRRLATGGDALPPEGAIAFVLDAAPLFPPGEGWAYTDTGYLLLGLVIEAALGGAYDDAVTARFLVPLGLTGTVPSNTRVIPGLAVGYTVPGNPFGMPPRTMDADGALVWDPAMEGTGGGLASTSRDLAAWGQALFTGQAMAAPYLDRLLDGVPVSPDAPDIRYGAGVAIYADTPRGPVYGHGGWIPGYVSSLRHYADPGVTVAFQLNTDAGVVDDSSDLVPALEAALADLAIAMAQAAGAGR
ncbi:serine hydrolase domain-containing protein [Roseicyclus persicicus]|uniref:Beta-lactamase family protein n=1 Tax=Roseicyclus persicicus TaxID=2650661 RepID=A0A7X6H1U0_9RHOB|nr:serine hydrolase domain-containing protein [Roseibacterium persicicum]NKX45784.1 beta-lactamase family protein [Roseibacterium persicicum]